MRKNIHAKACGFGIGMAAIWCMSLTLAAPVHAADDVGSYAVRGLGTLPCRDVVDRVDAQEQLPLELVAWTDGALSMANRLEPETHDLMPFRSPPDLPTRLAVNLCRSFPDITFDQAVNEVFALLHKIRLTKREADVLARIGDAKAQLSPATLVHMSDALVARGLLINKEEGHFGPLTVKALMAFQALQGLPQTGLPDQETLLRLLL